MNAIHILLFSLGALLVCGLVSMIEGHSRSRRGDDNDVPYRDGRRPGSPQAEPEPTFFWQENHRV